MKKYMHTVPIEQLSKIDKNMCERQLQHVCMHEAKCGSQDSFELDNVLDGNSPCISIFDDRNENMRSSFQLESKEDISPVTMNSEFFPDIPHQDFSNVPQYPLLFPALMSPSQHVYGFSQLDNISYGE